MTLSLNSFSGGGLAVVIGSTGGIGGALIEHLEASGTFDTVIGLSRRTTPALDLLDEASIAEAAAFMKEQGPLRLVIDATGILADEEMAPEKALRQIDPVQMARSYAINAIGPALLLKHFGPLMARDGKAVFATLSAKVGSISDNGLGGWISYRAAKAGLNQIVRTASIELGRRAPELAVLALHPGTVDTGLSKPFAKAGLEVQAPEVAGERLLSVIDTADASQTGGFFSYTGERLAW
ncbi:SDR family NAD(P)-dependent oxidoreductase [Stappia sp. ES.058]|uniref:SDR family NAD(P)-dependent oxidoreductase n=1 Tax=Stappia sp. ES.058 TaxID=1881061 RepID=UPI000B83AD6F|nr:SDR family NAD(P)-dependent oxidoreductase [Stappia sp. ES.058]